MKNKEHYKQTRIFNVNENRTDFVKAQVSKNQIKKKKAIGQSHRSRRRTKEGRGKVAQIMLAQKLPFRKSFNMHKEPRVSVKFFSLHLLPFLIRRKISHMLFCPLRDPLETERESI